MGTNIGGTTTGATVLAALSNSTKIIELAILAVVVVLLIVTVVLYRRRNAPAKAPAAGQAPTATSYYGEVSELAGGGPPGRLVPAHRAAGRRGPAGPGAPGCTRFGSALLGAEQRRGPAGRAARSCSCERPRARPCARAWRHPRPGRGGHRHLGPQPG